MRFVDMGLLELPNGWQTRADQALNELRNEIVQAEAVARAAGDDAATARRATIAAGLNLPARRRVWQDLKPFLARLRNEKCWYSESLNPMSDKDVDHFRPKGRVAGDPTHEGYWWLAFWSRNYRYSSQWCNQRRVDAVNDTSGGKGDNFPLCSGGVRARREGDAIELEDPELLDPTDPGDWKLLTFRKDGYPTPAKQLGTKEYERAASSIDVYHLHCKPLVNGRKAMVVTIQRLVQDLERLRPHIIDNGIIRAVYKSRKIELLQAIRPNSEYSAAAIAYSRAEIYTIERGRLVKRDWLEEILNAHP